MHAHGGKQQFYSFSYDRPLSEYYKEPLKELVPVNIARVDSVHDVKPTSYPSVTNIAKYDYEKENN